MRSPKRENSSQPHCNGTVKEALMPRLQIISCGGIVLAALGLVACDQQAVAPTPTANAAALDARSPSAPSGFYEMTFLNSAHEEVTSLPVGHGVSHVLIRVHVEDINHEPAQTGSVLYEMCRYTSTGKAAPSSACADGTARWSRWVDVEVNSLGDTWAGLDVVLNPCTIGFRATYGRGRTIAPGTMGPVDFSWTAQ